MSVDAQELERGALKRKDREQLLTIASALGHKPPTRARKDQIIDLILAASGDPTPTPAARSGPERSRRAEAAEVAEPLPFATQAMDASPPAPATAAPTASAPTMSAPTVSSTPPASAGRASISASGTPTESSTAASAAVTVASFSPFDGVDAPPMRRTRPPEAAPLTPASDSAPTTSDAPAPPASAPRRDRNGRNDGPADRGPVAPSQVERGSGEGGSGEGGSAERNDASVTNPSDTQATPERSELGERPAGSEGADNQGGQDNGGDGQGDREGSSRRRRRRGRDKDRVGGPGGQPQPGSDRQGSQDRQGNQDRQGSQDRQGNQDRDRQGNQDRQGNHDRDRQGNHDRDRYGEDAGQGSMEPVAMAGHLDLRDEGYGFLRVKGYLPSKDDVYVPAKFVRQYGLRKGDHLAGSSRPAGRGEKNPALLRIDEVNGDEPEKARARRRFEELTPLFPDQKLRLEQPGDATNMTARIIDLISPIGKGQRGLIVSPPKAGKTTVMKTIAQCIEVNNPEVKLIVLLVDERPEEVTDMRRSVRGEVVASTFDRPADEHTAVAEMTIERAKRMVEDGHDVVIILDGITRLARAYNLAAPATGRIMSGGIDTGALYPPKKFFGAARNIEEGGSLTILATALVETGSRMDEVIFEEFKGTGNMELRLDRRLAEKRIYPAIDVDASSTRHEELLFERRQLNMVWKLRRVLSGLAGDGPAGGGLELLVDRMKTFKSNDEFLAEVAKAPSM